MPWLPTYTAKKIDKVKICHLTRVTEVSQHKITHFVNFKCLSQPKNFETASWDQECSITSSWYGNPNPFSKQLYPIKSPLLMQQIHAWDIQKYDIETTLSEYNHKKRDERITAWQLRQNWISRNYSKNKKTQCIKWVVKKLKK